MIRPDDHPDPRQHATARDRCGRPSLFDDWLQDGLRRRYDATLDEPLPGDLLQVLNEVDKPRDDR